MANGKVLAAELHGQEVHAAFMHSKEALRRWDLTHKMRIEAGGGWVASYCGAGRIAEGRNTLSRVFLDHHTAEWMWWIDSDMAFEGDLLDLLVDSAHRRERPIMGGLCFRENDVGPGPYNTRLQEIQPTLYSWIDEGDQVGFATAPHYPTDEVMRVGATGAACLLIHRSVLAAIAEKHGAGCWFEPLPYKGRWFGEDMAFCIRAASCGYPVHVNTAAKTAHLKTFPLTEEGYQLQQSLKAAPHA